MIKEHYHYIYNKEQIIAIDIDLQHNLTDQKTVDIFSRPLLAIKLGQFSMALRVNILIRQARESIETRKSDPISSIA